VTVALLFGRQRRVASLDGFYGDFAGATAADLIPARSTVVNTNLPVVSTDSAMHHSSVWAALRLRANLLSTLPLDVFRKVDGVQVELPKPPILKAPSGDRVTMQEWLYSTQIDLDRTGNAFGLITERTGRACPPASTCCRPARSRFGSATASSSTGSGAKSSTPSRSGTRSSTPSPGCRSGCPRWPTPRTPWPSTSRSPTSR
jgi:hypothetical protein